MEITSPANWFSLALGNDIMRTLAAAFLLLASNSAFGQMLANPTIVADQGKMAAGGGFSVSTIEYDFGRDVDVERKILFSEAGFGLARNLDLYGQLGVIFDSEIEDVDYDGKGYMIGLGARFMVHQANGLKVTAYGLLNFTMEEFEGENMSVDVSCDVDITDLHVGSTVSFAANDTIRPYGGLELILSSDGDTKCRFKSGSATATSKNDADRDDRLNLHAGLNFQASSSLIVRPALILAGETTFVISVLTSY